MTIIRPKNENDEKGLSELLFLISSDLPHPIHARPGGVPRLVERLIQKDKLIVAENKGKLIGQLAYLVVGDTLKVNITSIAPNHRKTPVLYRMIEYLANSEDAMITSKVETVADPSSYGSLKVLEKLGFKIIGQTPDTFKPENMFNIYQGKTEELKRYFMRRINHR